jgi:hypothetical protein
MFFKKQLSLLLVLSSVVSSTPALRAGNMPEDVCSDLMHIAQTAEKVKFDHEKQTAHVFAAVNDDSLAGGICLALAGVASLVVVRYSDDTKAGKVLLGGLGSLIGGLGVYAIFDACAWRKLLELSPDKVNIIDQGAVAWQNIKDVYLSEETMIRGQGKYMTAHRGKIINIRLKNGDLMTLDTAKLPVEYRPFFEILTKMIEANAVAKQIV